MFWHELEGSRTSDTLMNWIRCVGNVNVCTVHFKTRQWNTHIYEMHVWNHLEAKDALFMFTLKPFRILFCCASFVKSFFLIFTIWMNQFYSFANFGILRKLNSIVSFYFGNSLNEFYKYKSNSILRAKNWNQTAKINYRYHEMNKYRMPKIIIHIPDIKFYS